MPYWTTQDYYDPFPGLAAGLAMRRQAQSEMQYRETMKQHALDKATKDQYDSQMLAMEAGKMAAAGGVDPVMGPDGRFDPYSTARNAVLKKETDRSAAALGYQHASMVDMAGTDAVLFPNAEEQKLMREPAYQEARAKAQVEFESRRIAHDVIRSKAMQPQWFDVGNGKKVLINPATGAEIKMDGELPSTAEDVKNSEGRTIGWRVGKQLIRNNESETDRMVREAREGNSKGTNAPAATPSPTGKARYRLDSQGRDLK